ncbi:MAG: amylo-alpha-1,6-glucosidase [Actinobacteria bacterium 13_2_20CM_2_71_6]|nr:MAG: amylo-alpha-1,6-glucosidase [Actinobacteria bacterium 13_2_20CM_2_71_6]
MSSIILGPQTCGSLVEGASREWLVPDGRGGYAMGTVAGLRTRRYHALLVVAGDRPAIRQVALASLDPVLELPSGAQVRLATHEWVSGAVSPAGHVHLERFDLTDGLPRWRWRVGGVVLERELAMVPGRSALGVVHRLLSGGPVRLRLDALCTWRDAHGERYGDGPLPTEPTTDGVEIAGAYRLAGPGWRPGGGWYRDAFLREEAARGLPATEDLWYAGQFLAELLPGETMEVTAWATGPAGATGPAASSSAATGAAAAGPATTSPRPPRAGTIVEAARSRAKELTRDAVDEADAHLRLAADAFVVDGPDVVAGYPWFGAWSRDTMISFEGLFLATGRAAQGRELLRRYAATLHDGLLANTADTGQVEYNTVDATLWFVHAVDAYTKATGDVDLGVELLPALETIRDAHERGTSYGIHVDSSDSLLTQGSPGYALTWMDARINGTPVTPRMGKPVEVNALWINALSVLAELRGRAGQDPTPVAAQVARATAAFRSRYPAPTGALYDVVDPADPAVRPNQLFAYRLPHGPLRGRPVPTAIDSLVTPLGLRTLAPDAPAYQGRHHGTAAQRDEAYHQGTVWPWLIGAYAEARQAAGQSTDGLLTGLTAHLHEYGLGSISETVDGDPPHAATGCPFQAWSVAEVLRVRRTLLI